MSLPRLACLCFLLGSLLGLSTLLLLEVLEPWNNPPHTNCPCDACNGNDLTPLTESNTP